MISIRSRALALSFVLLAACAPAPSSAPPSASPSAEPSVAAACPVVETSGPLPSDRLVDITIEATPTADLVTLVLGDRSSAPTNPTGKFSAIEPPFSQSGSGEAVDVPGARHVEIRLEGMLLSNDDGSSAYEGDFRFDPNLAALRSLVNVDAFEGHFTWIGGYDGLGCVTLLPNPAPNTFVVSFGH
jgi:hypothetical protein